MSIDDDPTTTTTTTAEEPSQLQQQQEQSRSSTCQQPNLSNSASFPIRRSCSSSSSKESSIEKDDSSKRESEGAVEKEGGQPSAQTTSQPAARRLSVQDRINLFENKQKESSGGKPAAVSKPPELRRLSSDVSSAPAAERAVLRRWSGASDMSIDLSGGDKKEFESPLPTPTPSSSSVSQSKTEDQKLFNDTPTFAKTEVGKDQNSYSSEVVTTKVGTSSGIQLTDSSLLEDTSGSNKSTSTSGKTRSWSSLSKADEDSVKVQTTSQSQFRSFPGGRGDGFGSVDQVKFRNSLGGDEQGAIKEQLASVTQIRGSEERTSNQAQFGAFASRSGDIQSASKSYQPPSLEVSNQGKEGEPKRDEPVPQSRLKASLKAALCQLERGFELKTEEPFAPAQHKGIEFGSLSSQSMWKSSTEVEEVGKIDFASNEKQIDSSTTNLVESGSQKMKFQKQVRRDESSYIHGNSKIPFSGKSMTDGLEGSDKSMLTAPLEQVHRSRQSKGNQELNDELKLKANELEKLFAEHKLRVPGDQSITTRRSKPTDTNTEQAVGLINRKQVVDAVPIQFLEQNTVLGSSDCSSNKAKLTSPSVTEMIDVPDYGNALQQSFSEMGFSDDSRGKFYASYTQKRDARLREVWGSNRAEKEAKMKAMHDSLERSRAEMEARFSGSSDRRDSVFTARRRAEKLRSFNNRSTREQPLDFGSEDDEDPSEFLEQKHFGDASFVNGVSRSLQGKKPMANRTSSISTPRTSAAPIPKSAVKPSSSGRRRMLSENPLAQSVPNFSDLRKENTKPYSAASKTIARPQLRNYTRSRSTSEEIPPAKEEKARRSQSLRKSTAGPVEFKDAMPIISESVILTPLKFDKEQTEPSIYPKFPKHVESKPFLRKNNGLGPGAASAIPKMKASMVSEAVINEEEYDTLAFESEYSVDVIKDEEEDGFEIRKTGDQAMEDLVESRFSQDSERSENGDVLRSFSQVDPCLAGELPATVTSTFPPIGSVQDSPGESPISWNSRTHHPFSYPHEASDIDASADSPMGSPASWNLHILNPTEADAARMRKKWGSAQKSILVSNSSGNQSRKDVTKGFKRLLKFGRKSRGSESLVDWISATTSEGDDDTEDGRDPANRSSEDLRKSRMGYSHGHPSEDSFNETDFFSEQAQALNSSIPAPPPNFRLREDHLSGSSIKAPRSFFSLSSFRSKGSDSKPR